MFRVGEGRGCGAGGELGEEFSVGEELLGGAAGLVKWGVVVVAGDIWRNWLLVQLEPAMKPKLVPPWNM